MEILVSVGGKKAEQMFNKQQSHAYQLYQQALEYKKYAIKRRDSKYIAATLKEARPMLEVEHNNLYKIERKGISEKNKRESTRIYFS